LLVPLVLIVQNDGSNGDSWYRGSDGDKDGANGDGISAYLEGTVISNEDYQDGGYDPFADFLVDQVRIRCQSSGDADCSSFSHAFSFERRCHGSHRVPVRYIR
jgi:hypothetical protein